MTALSILARMTGVPSTWPLLQEHTAKASSQSDIIKYSSEERESKPPYAEGFRGYTCILCTIAFVKE